MVFCGVKAKPHTNQTTRFFEFAASTPLPAVRALRVRFRWPWRIRRVAEKAGGAGAGGVNLQTIQGKGPATSNALGSDGARTQEKRVLAASRDMISRGT